MTPPTDEEVAALMARLDAEAEASGYHLNPDPEVTRELVRGLLINQERYGYPSCPCRLASGNKAEDLDIICPCDYRDPDLDEYGACYCALYVSEEVRSGAKKVRPVPERRSKQPKSAPTQQGKPGMTVWRCRVCGYLCARANPPSVCPICKAGRERFEPLQLTLSVIS